MEAFPGVSRLPGLVLNGGPGDACKNYQPGPPPLHILHPNSRIITAGIRRIKMYAGVIASAVHDALRRGLAIAVVRGPTNLLRTAHEEGDYFGALH